MGVAQIKKELLVEFGLALWVLACAEVFPTKTSTYALLVGALAGKEATRPIALKVLVQTAGSIQTGRGRSERLLVRFLSLHSLSKRKKIGNFRSQDNSSSSEKDHSCFKVCPFENQRSQRTLISQNFASTLKTQFL